MALTQISTDGIKNGTITGSDLATNVDLIDNQKIRFGTGNDLEIYHNGIHSYIENDTGQLYALVDAGLIINQVSSAENIAKFIANGGVELYHNNVKSIETISTGVGGAKISQSINLYRSSFGNGVIQNTIGNLYIEAKAGETAALFKTDGAVELYYDHSKKFETTSTGIQINGDLNFSDSNANDIHLRGGKIYGDDGAINTLEIRSTSGNVNHSRISIGEITNSDNGGIVFYGAGSSTADKKLTIRGTTNTVEIPDYHKFVCGNGSDLEIYHDATNSRIDNKTGAIILRNQAQDGDVLISGNDGGTNIILLTFDTSEAGLATLNGELNINGTNRIRFYHNTGNGSFNSFIGQRFINNSFNMVIDNQQNNIFYQSNQHVFRDKAGEGSEVHATMITNGAVDLYYDGNKKFETTLNGAEITGRLKIERGSAQNIALEIDTTSTTGACRIMFNESGTNKGQVAYSHDNDQIELLGASGNGAAIIVNGNQTAFKIDSSSRVVKPFQVAWAMHGSGNQQNLNGGTKVAFNTNGTGFGSFSNRNHGGVDTTNHSYTVPVTGLYSISVTIFFYTDNNNNTCSIVPRINGSEISNGNDTIFLFGSSAVNANMTLSGTILLQLNANDEITIHRRNGEAGTSKIYTPHSYFAGYLVG